MCSVKKFLKNFANLTEKTHVLEPLYSIETPTKVFSCEMCQIFSTPILKNDRYYKEQYLNSFTTDAVII